MVGQFSSPKHYGVSSRCGMARSSPISKASWMACAVSTVPVEIRTSNLSTIVESSENEIREIQRLTGFDLYWRLYFALT